MKMIPIGSIITEVVNNQLAGTFLGDVLWANRQITIPKLINSKAILPWGDYHDFANDELYSGKFYRSVFYFKDKFWFISWGHQDGPFCGLHYNKAILANEGIPDLWAYADQNNWNWDTFRDIALKTTRDFNGDGTTDQWGIAAYSADFATMLGMTNGVAPIYFENNEAKFGFNDPKSRQALLFMIQLWNIDKVVMPVVATGGTHLNAYYGGKAVMLPSTGIAHGKAAADNGLDKSSIGYTYLPKGPNSDTYVAFTNTGGHGLFLMSSAQDPQNITQIIRYLMAVYDPTRNGYGFGTDLDSIERKFNELYVYDERSMDMVMRKSYPYVNVIDYGINYGIPLDWRNMINKLVSNQSTVASTLDEMSTLLTEKIRSVDSGAIF
jgi:ABC-type glycerol-3-phosphate transport system substrate-binding protein